MCVAREVVVKHREERVETRNEGMYVLGIVRYSMLSVQFTRLMMVR